MPRTIDTPYGAPAAPLLCGAVGGPQYDALPREKRPEQGILRIRKELELFANLRPALLFDELASASSLKPELVSGLDILILRELTGDIYFGTPRGRRTNALGETEGYDTMLYSESEIRRIAEVGFQAAMKRNRKLTSVDKENVLETSRFWREIVKDVAKKYPQVELSHMYVDNAAMQLVRNPKQFDVIVTGNMFGDILSDEATELSGSLGLAGSINASDAHCMAQAQHGSAPDIQGMDKANPTSLILSAGMLLDWIARHRAGHENYARAAQVIEAAVDAHLGIANFLTSARYQVDITEAHMTMRLPVLTDGGIDLKAGLYSTLPDRVVKAWSVLHG